MICKNCGYENVKDAKFCENCGSKLEEIKPQVKEEKLTDAKTCPKCGYENDIDAKFCEACGLKLEEGKKIEEVKDDRIPCPSCGYRNDKDAKFCEACGKKLGKDQEDLGQTRIINKEKIEEIIEKNEEKREDQTTPETPKIEEKKESPIEEDKTSTPIILEDKNPQAEKEEKPLDFQKQKLDQAKKEEPSDLKKENPRENKDTDLAQIKKESPENLTDFGKKEKEIEKPRQEIPKSPKKEENQEREKTDLSKASFIEIKKRSQTERLGEDFQKDLNRELDKNRRAQRHDRSGEDFSKSQEKEKKNTLVYALIAGFCLIVLTVVVAVGYFGAKKDKEAATDQNGSASYQEIYDQAIDAYYSEDYNEAAEKFKSIPEEEVDLHTKAQKNLADIEKKLVSDLNSYMEDEDYSTAQSLAETYLKIIPNSQKIKDIYKKAKAGNNGEKFAKNRENHPTDLEASTDYDLEEMRRNNSYGENGNPKYTEIYKPEDFLNKSFRIDTGNGQARTAPDMNSEKYGDVYRGEVYHVYDVVSDGERYWLNIGDDAWISSKLITGEYRDK